MIFLGYESAWDYWRRAGKPLARTRGANPLDPLPSAKRNVTSQFYGHVPSWDTDIAYDLNVKGFFGSEYQLLVPEQNSRRWSSSISCSVLNMRLPHNAFLELTPRVMISGPEFLFLQFAICKDISFIDLILRGYELCGTYARIPGYGDKRALFRRQALTSKCRIVEFLDEVSALNASSRRNIYGLRTAKRALKYILDGSGSPMETLLTVLLCMPLRYGGYGLPNPALNEILIDGQIIYRATGRNCLIGDLFWCDKKLDIEYDSDEHHLEPSSKYDDDNKRNALLVNNFKVLTANKLHVLSQERTDVLAEQARKILKVRHQYVPQDLLYLRAKLRAEIFKLEKLKAIP